MGKYETPAEKFIHGQYEIERKRIQMQANLNRYGHKTAAGGIVWTVGDLQRFFADSKKRKRKK